MFKINMSEVLRRSTTKAPYLKYVPFNGYSPGENRFSAFWDYLTQLDKHEDWREYVEKNKIASDLPDFDYAVHLNKTWTYYANNGYSVIRKNK